MKNLSLFCLTLNPSHEDIIKKLSLIPVGLGNKIFSEKCLNDKTGDNIQEKNSFYGEYTFHYWIWKNHLDKIKTPWVGFCQYRKFFLTDKPIEKDIEFENLKKLLVKDENLHSHFDCILGEKFSVENYKISKIFKNHLTNFLKQPSLFFKKKKRNLKFHFDLFHGNGNLDKAIKHLDENNRDDFNMFMKKQTSFNPHNMFICKTDILKKYYNIIFPWLKKCEEEFGFQNLKGYGLQRIYGFLAERFLSYWFSKNYKIKEYPIVVKDLDDYKHL
tara:strand:- start:598 stop:1416 length:819 start_codon:yes stop_codon:yes gene_type:complete